MDIGAPAEAVSFVPLAFMRVSRVFFQPPIYTLMRESVPSVSASPSAVGVVSPARTFGPLLLAQTEGAPLGGGWAVLRVAEAAKQQGERVGGGSHVGAGCRPLAKAQREAPE
jgi:hypothetical protein